MRARTGIGLLDRAVGKARRIVAERSVYSDLAIPQDFQAVSFCFDDFPVTAARDGSKILEAAGLRGTFYTCFGTLGHASPSGRLASLEDVCALHRNGHEIGCHTFDHANCAFIGTAEATQSCGLNRRIAAGHGIPLTNFAYPQGGLRARTKKMLSTHYATARGSRAGINRGTVDAHGLQATPIYSHLPKTDARRSVDTVERGGGWVIFYTHDVAAAPSRYGTSNTGLRDLVAYVIAKNLPVLTVSEVVRLSRCADPLRGEDLSPMAARG